LTRVRADLDVPAHGEPAHDAVAIDHDGCGARYVLPVGAPTGVNQAVAPRDREVTVGHEPVAEAQALGDLLALLVGVGRDGHDLDAGALGLRQLGSKSLEL